MVQLLRSLTLRHVDRQEASIGSNKVTSSSAIEKPVSAGHHFNNQLKGQLDAEQVNFYLTAVLQQATLIKKVLAKCLKAQMSSVSQQSAEGGP